MSRRQRGTEICFPQTSKSNEVLCALITSKEHKILNRSDYSISFLKCFTDRHTVSHVIFIFLILTLKVMLNDDNV